LVHRVTNTVKSLTILPHPLYRLHRPPCDVDAEMYGHLEFHDKVVKRVQSLPRLKALRVALVMRAASRVKELVGIMPISERLDTGICQVESSSLLTREEIWPVLSYLK